MRPKYLSPGPVICLSIRRDSRDRRLRSTHIDAVTVPNYRIIDVAIEEVLPRESVAFVRVGGHPPDTLSATWEPTGSGPFNQLLFEKVVDRRVNGGDRTAAHAVRL